VTPALTIAGSDSGGGAGIQADVKTLHAHGVFATTVVTAVTAQNSVGITHVHEVPVAIVEAQLVAVLDDFDIAAAKTGMLVSSAITHAVAAILRERKVPRIVVDPVMAASSGHRLLAENALGALTGELFPLALCVTPNLHEAATLADMTIECVDDMQRAARRIREYGCGGVLIKGGHASFDRGTDVFFDGREVRVFRPRTVARDAFHGTGCVLSAALTARLALGEDLLSAVEHAKAYLSDALEAAPVVGGRGGRATS
jgi:hydroxymethylpyrimidine/phosphomethylpyrimidine kinase